jgi:small subunit ribosomal protein S8
MSIDRTSNMVSALKNSAMAGRSVLELPHTIECESIAKVLKDGGFIEEVKVFKEESSKSKMLGLTLSKEDGVIKLSHARRISKPGRRIYKKSAELRPVLQGMGVLVVSTSRGIMDGREAKKKKLGGEVLCEVY